MLLGNHETTAVNCGSILVCGPPADLILFVCGYYFEASLFDFDRDIYGEEVIVYPTAFIRENKRYDSQAALIEQIGMDKKTVLNMIDKGEKQWQ